MWALRRLHFQRHAWDTRRSPEAAALQHSRAPFASHATSRPPAAGSGQGPGASVRRTCGAGRLGLAVAVFSAMGGLDAQPASAKQPPSFRVHRISGDGACMFRAIVQGLQLSTRGTPMPVESEGTAAQNLRQAVVQELRKRRDEIEPFLPGIATDFEQYLKTMSSPMAWGGEPEMVMAVHVVRRPITVYHVTRDGLEPIVTYGDQLLASGVTPVSLLWSGAHYDLLVPAEP